MERIEVIVNLNLAKMSYQIPFDWSINKLKCLLCQEIPKLDFNQFELSNCSELLRGTHKLFQLCSNSSRQFEVSIVKMKSQILFEQYYRASIHNFLKKYQYQNQPVLIPDHLLNFPSVENNANNAELNEERQNLNDPFFELQPLFRIIHFFSIYLMVILILQNGKSHQITIIAICVFLLSLIECYRKYHKRRMKKKSKKQNKKKTRKVKEKEKEKKVEQNNLKNVILGNIIMYSFKSFEIMYTLVYTLLPNLEIDIYLHANEREINWMRRAVNKWLPQTYSPDYNEAN